MYITHYVHRFEEKEDRAKIDLDREFQPSLLNSAIYLLQLIQQISTFSINYIGRPFRESIRENKGMYWGLVAVAAIAFSCATEFVPEVNGWLKLVPFTMQFKIEMTSVMILDYGGCWIVERVLKNLFSDYKPKDIAVRRPDQIAVQQKRMQAEHDATQRAIEQKAGKA